jgi:hypothetical protein
VHISVAEILTQQQLKRGVTLQLSQVAAPAPGSLLGHLCQAVQTCHQVDQVQQTVVMSHKLQQILQEANSLLEQFLDGMHAYAW